MRHHAPSRLRWSPAAIVGASAVRDRRRRAMPAADLLDRDAGGVAQRVLILLWWLFLSRAPWIERIGVVPRGRRRRPGDEVAVDPSIAGGARDARLHPRHRILRLAPSRYGQWQRIASPRSRAASGTGPGVACPRLRADAGDSNRRHQRRRLRVALAMDADAGGTAAGARRRRAEAVEQPPASAIPCHSSCRARRQTTHPLHLSHRDTRRICGTRSTGCTRSRPQSPSGPASADPTATASSATRAINTDWTAAPPIEMWRRPVGPGWSSFSVRGDVLYTQEQRGDDEIVACYQRVDRRAGVAPSRSRFASTNRTAAPVRAARRPFTATASTRWAPPACLNALDASTGKVIVVARRVKRHGTRSADVGHLELAARSSTTW